MLAAKTALAVRYDALGEDVTTEMGIENRATLEARLRFFEEGGVRYIIFSVFVIFFRWGTHPSALSVTFNLASVRPSVRDQQ